MVQSREIPQTGTGEVITDANGDGTVAITFKEPMNTTNYYADAGIQEADITGNVTIGSKTKLGFTAVLDGSAVISTEVIDASGNAITLNDMSQEVIDASGVNLTLNDMSQEVIDASSVNITFADADPDTITRASGDWTTRFAVGDIITSFDDGSDTNGGTYEIAVVTTTVITLIGSDALSNEANTTDTFTFSIATPTLGCEIVRASGTWATRFVDGDEITVSDDGSDVNAGTYTIDTVAALTLTLIVADELVQEANSTDEFTFVITEPTLGCTIVRNSGDWGTLFTVGEVITVSDDGSDINAGSYTIATISTVTMTLIVADELTQEANSTDTFTFVTDNGVTIDWIARQNEW